MRLFSSNRESESDLKSFIDGQLSYTKNKDSTLVDRAVSGLLLVRVRGGKESGREVCEGRGNGDVDGAGGRNRMGRGDAI